MQGSYSFLSPLAIFHPLNLGLDSPFYRKQTSHLKAPFLYLSLLIFPCLSPPTNQIHFMSAQALLSWQSFEIALSQFLLFFFFFSCLAILSTCFFQASIPKLHWNPFKNASNNYMDARWRGDLTEQLGGQKFRVLDLGSLLTGVTTGNNQSHFSLVNQSSSVPSTRYSFLADLFYG